MNKIRAFFILLPIAAFALVGCDTEVIDNPIIITSGIAKIRHPMDSTEHYFQLGDTIVYKFEVTSPNGISKIEFSNFQGVGVNQKAPVILSKVENLSGTTWTLVDTIKNIQEDVRYSIYVEDKNRQFKTQQINAYLDISRFMALVLYDGLINGTSKTFLNVESGRTFFVANTINDPTAMDFGFAFLEAHSAVLACFVSFDEYWNTGNYPSIVNNLNQPIIFKKWGIGTTVNTWIKANVKNSADLKAKFDAAINYPTVAPLFPDTKVALNIKAKDVISFKTADGRYGLIQVTYVNARSNSTANNQTITLSMVVDKKPLTNN